MKEQVTAPPPTSGEATEGQRRGTERAAAAIGLAAAALFWLRRDCVVDPYLLRAGNGVKEDDGN